MKKILLVVFLVFLFAAPSQSQVFNKFSFAGGIITGWHFPKVADLNSTLRNNSIPEMSSNGFFTFGGGGFIDVPVVKHLRIGGIGLGYSQDRSAELTKDIITNVNYSYAMGGITIEYVHPVQDNFNITYGGMLGIGSLNITRSNYSKDYQTGGLGFPLTDANPVLVKETFKYSAKVYSLTPTVGAGFQLTSFLYLKMNAGYTFSMQNKWKLDDTYEVEGISTGIKADGLNFNIGLYAGLFVK